MQKDNTLTLGRRQKQGVHNACTRLNLLCVPVSLCPCHWLLPLPRKGKKNRPLDWSNRGTADRRRQDHMVRHNGPGLEHPGRCVAKKQDNGPLDWSIRGAADRRRPKSKMQARPPGLEHPGGCGQRPWTGTSGEGARRRSPGLEHPGGQPTANDWNNRSVAKKQDGGPLDWNIRGAVETRNAAPWTGASGGMRTDALDWNIRGRSR